MNSDFNNPAGLELYVSKLEPMGAVCLIRRESSIAAVDYGRHRALLIKLVPVCACGELGLH